MNPERTSTSTDGQSQSPVTPWYKEVFRDDGAAAWLVDFGDGRLSFHCEFYKKLGHKSIWKYRKLWLEFVGQLLDRGIDQVFTQNNNETHYQFASWFGFEPTGEIREVPDAEGNMIEYTEMVFDMRGLR